MVDVLSYSSDFILAERCLDGDEAAVACLIETYGPTLVNYLLHAGASPGEAKELIDEFWGECLTERHLRRPRLATYAGNSPLQGWLKAVALNKLIQLKRQQARRGRIIREEPVTDNELEVGGSDPAAGGDHGSSERPLLEIMRGAVESAFRQCQPEAFVLLQLHHAHGLLQRELAFMFQCSESTISRDLEAAKSRVAAATLDHVRKQDPWLELKWEDFVESAGW